MKKVPAILFLSLLFILQLSLGTPLQASELGRFDTVIIDAGHGGHDRGGIPGQRVPEKVVALDVAQRLRDNLRRAGLKTVMTRSSDTFIPLGGRVAASNSRNRCIFVSIHFNSARNLDAHGIETYFYSSKSAPLAATIHRRLLRVATMDRGIKRRGYFVLRKNRVPAVLLELGFLTNRGDARLAVESRYRQKLADEIAKGITSTRANFR